jgi:hypothetical protein
MYGVHQPGHDRPRLVLVLDSLQDSQQHDRDRLREVQDAGGLLQDRGRGAQIGVDVDGRTLRAAGQQGPGG